MWMMLCLRLGNALSIAKDLKSESKDSLSLVSFAILFIIKVYVKMSKQDEILLILCLKVPFITRNSLVIWRLLIVISSIVQEWMNGPKLKKFVGHLCFLGV
uniref:Uncharacterized protein n=1 Tax=Opuntia streptacantha TaxID=393608 RepID=A0A7C9AGJ8_OPUST